MFWFFFFFGLALAAASPSGDHEVKLQRGDCPPFWFSFNNRCYKYVSTHMTWADAEIYCQSEKANLVSIYTLEEQTFVKSLIKNFDHAEGFTWIGLSDTHKEGNWMWSDGCPAKFRFWDENEPSNYEGNEDCVHNNHDASDKWNDISCFNSYPSVCASRIVCP